MRHAPNHLLVLAASTALAALGAAPPAAAQDPRPGVFGEVLDVRVVNLEVVVTDRDGARVRGLGPQDFRLTVDGEEVPIDFFSEVVGGTVAAGAAGTAGAPGATAGQPLGTSWLVFIDDFFSIGRHRDEVLESLEAQLGLLGPQDRMALVSWDGRRLTMLSSWTRSLPALERALEEARRRTAHGLERLGERRAFEAHRTNVGSLASIRRNGPFSTLEIDERQYVDQLTSQVRRSVSAAAATLRAFANPPGRKVMLLLCGGWPWNPGEYLIDTSGRLLTSEVPAGKELYGQLIDTANLLGYTLYPIDVPGVEDTLADASRTAPVAPSELTRREQELHASLSYLARATGGREMVNAQRLHAFESALEDTRSFYWLGFTPKRQGDDEEHEVRVEVRQPRLRVRLRDGFRDLSRSAEVSMAVESALLFGNAPSTSPLTVSLGKPDRKGRRLLVPLQVLVPVGELTALPVGESHVVEVELRIAAQDAEGNTAPIPVVPLQIRMARAPAAGEVAAYSTTLELRRAPHDLVIALYEPVTGKVFSAAARIAP